MCGILPSTSMSVTFNTAVVLALIHRALYSSWKKKGSDVMKKHEHKHSRQMMTAEDAAQFFSFHPVIRASESMRVEQGAN